MKFLRPSSRRLKYQLRLFITAALCIWTVVLGFTFFVARREHHTRLESAVERIDLTNGNIVDAQMGDRPIKPFMDFINGYLVDTYLHDLSIQVYDIRTRKLIHSIGKPYDFTPDKALEAERTVEHDGSKLIRLIDTRMGPSNMRFFYYSIRITPDGEVEIRTYVPYSKEIDEALTISPVLWVFMIAIGIFGTIMAYITTAHQARNVSLLHDFAQRAASDKGFIPMGDFPSDEIGDISRQIVAIYNSRMQANVRREREHVIALKATEEKNKMKRMLTDNISHELKTPIGIIRAYIDMLLTQPDMPEEDRLHFLQKAQQNVERLVSMLADLSTMTRLEESGGNIPLKEIDFSSTIINLAEEMEQSGILGDMEFRHNIPQECIITGNEGLLNSALQNLIKNAKAYSQGTMMGIDLIGQTDNYYTFSFYDDGVGVAEEHISHLFDRFYRVDAGRSRKAGGTGLGLPIAKSSINTMGGSMVVRNRRGASGLEFVFTLPRPRKGKPGAGKPSDKSA